MDFTLLDTVKAITSECFPSYDLCFCLLLFFWTKHCHLFLPELLLNQIFHLLNASGSIVWTWTHLDLKFRLFFFILFKVNSLHECCSTTALASAFCSLDDSNPFFRCHGFNRFLQQHSQKGMDKAKLLGLCVLLTAHLSKWNNETF